MDPGPFWLREEGSGEKLCPEMSCWNAMASKFNKLPFQIFNAIG